MLFDGILETTTTTGTGDLTTSAVTGRPRFTDIFAANASESSADPFYYAVTTQDSPPQFLEIGIGYCSAAGTLKRAQVIATYAAGAFSHFPATPASLPAGTKNVVCNGGALTTGPNMPDIVSSSSAKRIAPQHYGTLGSAGTFTKDRLHYVPVYLPVAKRILSLRMQCGSTGGTTPTHGFHVGLYSMLRSGLPGRRIVESGDMTTSGGYAENVYTLGAATRLPPGWYYLAIVHDFAGTNPAVYYTSTGIGLTPLGSGVSSGANLSCYEALTAGWTNMPAVAGATPTMINGGNNSPLVLLGVE